jgi:hypothetical protein
MTSDVSDDVIAGYIAGITLLEVPANRGRYPVSSL